MSSVIFFSILYALCNVAGAVIIKFKLQSVQIINIKDFISFILDPKILLAMLFIFISMFFSMKALSIAKFSSAIPMMTGINFIFTLSVGYFLFKDTLAISGYIGVILIITGIYLLGISQ